MIHTRTLRSHKGAVLGVRYTNDGAYCMSCGADRRILLWNPSRPAAQTGALLIKEYSGQHASEVSKVAIARDSTRFASCGGDSAAFVWNVATGAVLKRLEGHAARINAVAFAGVDEQVLATASYDNTARLWDLRSQSRAAIQTLSDFKDSVTSLVVARDRATDWAIVAASVDGCVRTYDLRRGLMNSDNLGAPVTSVALSHDGGLLYGTNRVLWRLVNADIAAELDGVHTRATSSLAWHPKAANLLAASFDGAISFWTTHGSNSD
ncbi:hypothetical protein CTAYLR_006465 [Chrysophaeum taylorii]|uniref:Uncharacterized protein n=1 Tax=Chrysophaeum taylorii TaxID=2483200 RepID=A0AAD7UMC9_9STRA|nr:hypothetical protein CTAYLR_006465 [Chrysophaeum taylorii]